MKKIIQIAFDNANRTFALTEDGKLYELFRFSNRSDEWIEVKAKFKDIN